MRMPYFGYWDTSPSGVIEFPDKIVFCYRSCRNNYLGTAPSGVEGDVIYLRFDGKRDANHFSGIAMT